MASYKTTELGQVQQSLNAITQKWRRKVAKSRVLKTKIQAMKEKALQEDLPKTEQVKLNCLELEIKHTLADVTSLAQEIENLKSIKDSKKADKKKKKDNGLAEVQAEAEAALAGNDDAFLYNLYGLNQDGAPQDAGGEQEVDFLNM